MYQWINQQIKAQSEKPFNARAAKYGDGFFETIYADGDNLFLFDLHYERIIKSFKYLYFNEANLPTKEALKNTIIEHLLSRPKEQNRISLHFYRDAIGFYTPSSNDTAFDISIQRLDVPKNKGNYNIGIYTENKKYANPISEIKSSNALISVLAASWKAMAGIDDAIILNNENNICEATASNIFIIKDKKIITPPLRDAPIDGVMRRFIIETLLEKNIIVIEKSISDKELFDADEVFLSNTIQKIQSVSSFGNSIEYGRRYTEELRILLGL
jgi:branched-chain amino acid aminotransferase